jgi:hypothetical protein
MDFEDEAIKLNDKCHLGVDLFIPQHYQDIVDGIEHFVNFDIHLNEGSQSLNSEIRDLLENYAHLYGRNEPNYIDLVSTIKRNIAKILFLTWRISEQKMMNTNFCETYQRGAPMPKSLKFLDWLSRMDDVCEYDEDLFEAIFKDYDTDLEVFIDPYYDIYNDEDELEFEQMHIEEEQWENVADFVDVQGGAMPCNGHFSMEFTLAC